jgi:hypothetical protein
MADKIKLISGEDGQKILERLQREPEYLAEFLTSPDVKSILEAAIRACSRQNDITVNDFISAIYIFSKSELNWFEKIDNPGAVYGYFKKMVRNLLTNRKFMRDLMGIDPKLDGQIDSMDTKEDKDKSLAEKLVEEETENSSEIETIKVDRFREIVCLVTEKSLKFGELLNRTYLKGEPAESIAVDFLQRGLIISRDIESAIKNIQNSLLPRARDRFNAIALEKNYHFRIEGKVKKSIIKKIKIN